MSLLAKQIVECEKRIAKLEFELAVEKKLEEALEAALFQNQWQQSICTADRIKVILADGPRSPKQIGLALIEFGVCGAGKTKLNRIASACVQRRTDLFRSAGRGKYELAESEAAEVQTDGKD